MAERPENGLVARYDREAGAYQEWWAPVLRKAGRRMLGKLREEGSDGVRVVLDVGAGVGALLPDLAAAFRGATVVGVDRSRGMISLAPDSFPRAVMDAQRLAVAPESVDRVAMAFMLFHLPSPLAGLRESHRVLRHGGWFGSVTWGGELDSAAIQIWTECLDTHDAPTPEPSAPARHELVDTPEKMEAMLREAGFSVARAWTEDLVYVLEAEHLIRLRTGLGSSKPRYDGLSAEAQKACVAEACQRMQALGEGDFEARGRIVYATARK